MSSGSSDDEAEPWHSESESSLLTRVRLERLSRCATSCGGTSGSGGEVIVMVGVGPRVCGAFPITHQLAEGGGRSSIWWLLGRA